MFIHNLLHLLTRQKFVIALVLLGTFLILIMGILYGIHRGLTLEDGWKEILLVIFPAVGTMLTLTLKDFFSENEKEKDLINRSTSESQVEKE